MRRQEVCQRSTWAGGVRLAGAAGLAVLGQTWGGAWAAPTDEDAGPPAVGPAAATGLAGDDVVELAYELIVESALGLSDCRVVALDVTAEPGTAFALDVPIDGVVRTLRLAPHAVRSPGYRLLVQMEDGALVPGTPGTVRTLRGTVDDVPDAVVAASHLEDGLHVMIDLGPDGRYWIEPVWHLLPGGVERSVIYRGVDVLPHDGSCGTPDARIADQKGNVLAQVGGGDVLGGGGPCIAELACDADTEYFNRYGSVANTEARINSVINTVNVQYENQVGITHLITTILVRTGTDPYTSTDAQTRLCQFITEWTNNRGGIQRNVAHLFTGVDLNGSTIGIAADIGVTGICVNSGGCTGGQFGTFGSYCLSQSDFNGNFSCATDLTAHEMGHLWGAFHCSCSGNTMNSSITCANNFSAGSINSITNYRDTRQCLDGNCEPPPAPANDACVDAEAISCNASLTVDTALATPPPGGSDPELPSGSPSCQWQGNPANTHNTVWYAFVAEDTSLEIQTCATTAIQDTILALYAGTCGSLSQLACAEDDCGSTTYMSRICYDGLVPGNTYTFVVGSPGGWSGSTGGVIELDVACPCPDIGPVAGACCLNDGSCVDFQTPAMCGGLGGTFQGAGTDCATANCAPPPTGACCLTVGGCIETTSNDCAGQGSYQGDGTTCAGDPCSGPTGACCFPDDTCAVVEEPDCLGQGGTWQAGTDCTDTDGDGVADECDGCPNDPNKTDPGVCGCGVPDVDSDGDGTLDCNDGCPSDPDKIDPGVCGCGVPDTDSDGDGVEDCIDGCPGDPNKTDPGVCGCGVPDTDSDGDGTPDCIDGCPGDPDKTDPGVCGCGVPDTDSDGDGTPDCNDGCPNDPNKTVPGACGCGVPDTDSDGDGVEDCIDNCPNVFNPGQEDGDGDGIGDACEDTGGVGLLEAGTVNVGSAWVTVNLTDGYTNPVVVCSVQYSNNTTPVVTRVRNVTGNGFQVRLQNPSNGAVAAETVSYLVVEEGVHTIDGVNIEAQLYTSTVTDENNSWVGQTRSYGRSYTSPVVVGQVMSENDPDWSVFWCRGTRRQNPPSSSSLRTGKTVCEDPDNTRASETVGFIVIEAGSGTIGGVAYRAALGGDSIRGISNGPPYNYGYGSAFGSSPDVRVVTQAGMDGGNGGWAYVFGGGGSASTLSLAIDEDQVRDSERSHTTEQVGYVVFETAVAVQ